MILAFDLFDNFHLAVPKSLFLGFLRSDTCIEEKHVYETSSIARTTSIDRIPADRVFFRIRFKYDPQSQCPVLIWAIVLDSRFGALPRNDFLGTGGRIACLPFSVSISFAVVESWETRSLSQAIEVCPCFFCDAASPASWSARSLPETPV
jgi:hypothetical protein